MNGSRTIFIDNPLPSKTMTPREVNVMYFGDELCRMLKKPLNSNNDSGNQTYATKTQKNYIEERDCRESLKNDCNLIKEAMEHDNDLTICEENIPIGNRNDLFADSSLKDAFIVDDKISNDGDEMSQHEDMDKEKIQNLSQFTYSLWTFGTLNLLIRTSDCGLLHQPNRKSGRGALHPVNVFIKPEYQLCYGYEKITMSEASRCWIHTYCNPESVCVCARVSFLTGELLKLDVLNQSDILALSSFDPAKPMKAIHGIFTRLQKLLLPGKYILSHSANDLHICVYNVAKDATKKSVYDLHLAHSNNFLVQYDKNVPWVPVDPNIFLDWHIAFNRIPLTFPPVSTDKSRKVHLQNAGQGKKNSKTSKKKKKKGGKHVNNFNVGIQSKNNTFQISDEQEIAGIAERLRSKARPVTYDDIDFNF